MSLATDIRAHLLASRAGVLSTLSADSQTAGYPFGSIVPYALDAHGAPQILISRIAQHTRNLQADPRASLLVSQADTEGDPQAGWRVTVMGRFTRLVAAPSGHPGPERVTSAEELERIHARYVERVPKAPGYFGTHDFDYWALDVERVRYIGGFGRIHWVEPADYLHRDEALEVAAPRIISHMNEDHRDALRDYCAGLYGITPDDAELVGVEPAGFFVQTRGPDRLFHFGFGKEIAAADARYAFKDVLERARAAITPAP